jgi:chemotaxis response regulator CheB
VLIEPGATSSPLRIAVLGGQRARDVEAVVRGLSNDLGFAVIVACATAPDLAQSLTAVSTLPVIELRVPAKLEPDRIYVVPTDHEVEARDGHLVAVRSATAAPLDKLLRSLAETHGAATAVVLLGGPGADGVLGLKRIKEAGRRHDRAAPRRR